MASDENPRKIPRKPWEPFRGLKITPPPEEESSDPEIREYQNQRYRHDFEGGPEPRVMPRRPVRVESPFMGRTYELGSVPYNIAPAANMAAQAIYGQKTLPLYFNPYTAPFARAVDAYETAKRIKENPKNPMNYLGVPGTVMGANKLGAMAVGAGAIGGTEMQEQAQAPEHPVPTRSRIMGDERVSNANRLAASLTDPKQFSKLISHSGPEVLPMRLPYGQRFDQRTGELNSPQSKDIGFQGPIENVGHEVTEYTSDRDRMQYPTIYQGMSDEDRGSVLAAERFGENVPEAVDQRAYEAAKGRVEQGRSQFYEPGKDPYPAWSPDQHWEDPVVREPHAFGGEAYAADVGMAGMADGGSVGRVPRGGGGKALLKEALSIINRLPQSKKISDGRIRELAILAQHLGDSVTPEMYQAAVNEFKPVRVYESVPTPSTTEDLYRGLSAQKHSKIGKGFEIPEGHPVGNRLDIPAYTHHGVWAPTIHDMAAKSPVTIAHEPAARVMMPEFFVPENKALAVAQGGNKSPFATINGRWAPSSVEDVYESAQKYLNHPDWRQVGMDPERHSYFYDRATQEPIKSAEEALQVGPLVLAKNPVYGRREDFKYSRGGDVNFKLDKNPKWRMSLEDGGVPDEGGYMKPGAKGGRAVEDALRLARDHMRRGGHPKANPKGPAFAPHFGSDREAMIRTMLAEARGEGLKGMEAVGYNLRNRADANYGNYGSSIADQALGRRPGSKYGEYSSWNPYGKPSNAGKSALKIPESSAIYKQAAAAADTVLGRMEQDPTMGSSNYRNSAASSKKSDAWFNKLQDKVDIGHHTFGRAPGFHVPVAQSTPKIGDTAMLQGVNPTPQAMQMAGLPGGAGAKMSLPQGMQGAAPQMMMAQAAPAAPTPPHQGGASGQQIISSPLARINPADPSGPPAPAKLPDVDVGRASPPPMQMASAAPAAQPNEPPPAANKMEMPNSPPGASASTPAEESASAQGEGPTAPEAPQMQQDIFGQPFEPPEFLQGLQHVFARGGSVDHALKIAHEAMKKGGGAWTRKEGKNPEGGLNAKGRASAKAEGHNLKPPAPHPKTEKDAGRRKSFCSRMKGMKAKLTSAETARDPDSRINKSLRAWNCADGGEVWDKPRPKNLGKSHALSTAQKASAKAAAKAAGRPYPNMVDNIRAAKKK